jgi:DNA-binding CsgD family transcriptional regulator
VVAVATGEHPALSPEVGYALIDRIQHAARREFARGLTPREHQVMGLLLSGRSDKEIASRLGTAPATVHAHKAHLFRKLGAHNSAEAVRKFLGAE